MMKNLLANWKTTSAGATMIVTGTVHLIFAAHNHSLTEQDCTTTILAIGAGVGLLAAGDAGVKPPTDGAQGTGRPTLPGPNV
jgi:hypothetical protein